MNHTSSYTEDQAASAKPRLRLQERDSAPVAVPAPVSKPAPAPAPVSVPAPPAPVARTNHDEAANASASYLELAYTGSPLSLIKLWLLNLVYSVCSLGFLIPLAIARTNAHFYRSIALNGKNFEVEVQAKKACLLFLPIPLLVAGAAAVAFFEVTSYAYHIATGLVIAALFVLPFFVFELIKSSTEAISYDRIKVNFTGTSWYTIKKYLLIPLALIGFNAIYIKVNGFYMLSAGLVGFIPLLITALVAFYVLGSSNSDFRFSNLQFGKTRLTFNIDNKERQFIGTFPLMLWGGLHLAIYGVFYLLNRFSILEWGEVAAFLRPSPTGEYLRGAQFVSFGFWIVQGTFFFWWKTYSLIKTHRYYLERIELGSASLVCAYSVGQYVMLRFTNRLMMLVSLGFLRPLCATREYEYMIHNLALIASPQSLDKICRDARA